MAESHFLTLKANRNLRVGFPQVEQTQTQTPYTMKVIASSKMMFIQPVTIRLV